MNKQKTLTIDEREAAEKALTFLGLFAKKPRTIHFSELLRGFFAHLDLKRTYFFALILKNRQNSLYIHIKYRYCTLYSHAK